MFSGEIWVGFGVYKLHGHPVHDKIEHGGD